MSEVTYIVVPEVQSLNIRWQLARWFGSGEKGDRLGASFVVMEQSIQTRRVQCVVSVYKLHRVLLFEWNRILFTNPYMQQICSRRLLKRLWQKYELISIKINGSTRIEKSWKCCDNIRTLIVSYFYFYVTRFSKVVCCILEMIKVIKLYVDKSGPP